ncbi:rhomboid family intramembrane serine protease [Candidatus Gracilibacteria bacterium 28_42_T64]|nr:rhomboid family intramembrane serine protease [Candidatus Gracilibacteria bacterium 28_42_T64]
MFHYNKGPLVMSVSNILIGVSFICTLGASIFPVLYLFGFNDIFLTRGDYHIYIIQFFTSTFLHAGFFHFIANALFLYIFGNVVELLIGKKKYIGFFIFAIFFIGSGLTFINAGNTVGISGFCMALLSYYTLELKSQNNVDYKGGITAIILNIAIGLHPGISLFGHLFGVIGGILFYIFNKTFFKNILLGIKNS